MHPTPRPSAFDEPQERCFAASSFASSPSKHQATYLAGDILSLYSCNKDSIYFAIIKMCYALFSTFFLTIASMPLRDTIYLHDIYRTSAYIPQLPRCSIGCREQPSAVCPCRYTILRLSYRQRAIRATARYTFATAST